MVGKFWDYEQLYRQSWLQCYEHLRWLRCEDEECCLEFPCETCRQYVEGKIERLIKHYLSDQPEMTCPACGVKQYFLYGVGCETKGCVNYHVNLEQPEFCPF